MLDEVIKLFSHPSIHRRRPESFVVGLWMTLFMCLWISSPVELEATEPEDYPKLYGKYRAVSYTYAHKEKGPVLLVRSSGSKTSRNLEEELCLTRQGELFSLKDCFTEKRTNQVLEIEFLSKEEAQQALEDQFSAKLTYFRLKLDGLCLSAAPGGVNNSWKLTLASCINSETDPGYHQYLSLEPTTELEYQYNYLNFHRKDQERLYLAKKKDCPELAAKLGNKSSTTFMVPRFHFRDPLPLIPLKVKPADKIPVAKIEDFYKSGKFKLRFGEKKPNVFFFMVDTLRFDAISKSIAPEITKLRDHSLELSKTISGATATHHSMFSLMNSRPAYERNFFDESRADGISLRQESSMVAKIFKELGYEIRMFSDPVYYDTLEEGRVTSKEYGSGFYCVPPNGAGANCQNYEEAKYPFRTSMQLFHEAPIAGSNLSLETGTDIHTKYTPGDMDIQVIEGFLKFLDSLQPSDTNPQPKREGHFAMVYLFGTHYPHSISTVHSSLTLRAEYRKLQHTGESKDPWGYQSWLDELKLISDPSEKVKFLNTYYNTAMLVDFQIGRALRKIMDLKLYGDSYILFVADHGESLFENGTILHGGLPFQEQTQIPIFLKIPGSQKLTGAEGRVGSSLDVFPTLLDHLGVEPATEDGPRYEDLFAGRPFNKGGKRCHVSIEPYGFIKHPVQFVFYDEASQKKVRLRFQLKGTSGSSSTWPLRSKAVEMIAYTDFEDHPQKFTGTATTLLQDFKDCFERFLGQEIQVSQ